MEGIYKFESPLDAGWFQSLAKLTLTSFHPVWLSLTGKTFPFLMLSLWRLLWQGADFAEMLLQKLSPLSPSFPPDSGARVNQNQNVSFWKFFTRPNIKDGCVFIWQTVNHGFNWCRSTYPLEIQPTLMYSTQATILKKTLFAFENLLEYRLRLYGIFSCSRILKAPFALKLSTPPYCRQQGS